MPLRSRTNPKRNLLRRVNERAVFELVRRLGPTSRPELKRRMGVTAPTVSKAVASLLRAGLLEEMGISTPRDRAGRPFAVYRVASGSARVLGAMVGVRYCTVVTAGLDGVIDEPRTIHFDTPDTYERLIDALARAATRLLRATTASAVSVSSSNSGSGGSKGRAAQKVPVMLGMGLSVPGEIDASAQRVLFSPNLHLLNGRSPGADLSKRLGVPVVLVHDTIASALAEQLHGAAREMSDFVRIGVYEGFGVSVVSGGRPLEGRRGLAGELGHVTVDPAGPQCGCGNRGCLETVATDASFARRVSKRLGKKLTVEEIIERSRAGELDVRAELDETLGWLAIGLSAAINLFNPQAVLLTSRMLDVDAGAFARLQEQTAARSLRASLEDCRIVRVAENVRQGVVAAMVSHLTDQLGPAVP